MTVAGAPAGGAGSVVVGRDGFLFHSHDRAFEQLCAGTLPCDRLLGHWASLLESSSAWCAAKGISFVSLVVPERHVIHADRLPPGKTIAPNRAIVRLMAMIEPAMQPVLYPEAELAQASAEGEVYLQTDERPNLRGYHACYLALLAALRPRLPLDPLGIDALPVRRLHLSGSLGMRLDTEPSEDVAVWLASPHTWRVFSKHGSAGRFEIVHGRNTALPRAILFGDAHVDAMRHILTAHFSRTLIVYNCHQLFHELCRRERPDVVIHVMSELRLGREAWDGSATLQVIDTFFEEREGPLPPPGAVFALDFDICGQCDALLGDGWSHVEQTHTWMTDEVSLLRLPPEIGRILDGTENKLQLELTLVPKLGGLQHRRQRLAVCIGREGDWHELARCEVTDSATLVIPLTVPLRGTESPLWLRFEHPDGYAPADHGAVDRRRLSFAARALQIVPSKRLSA